MLRSNKRWFEGVSLVVISNTLWVGERVPCLTYGMRGMISLSIEVRLRVGFLFTLHSICMRALEMKGVPNAFDWP